MVDPAQFVEDNWALIVSAPWAFLAAVMIGIVVGALWSQRRIAILKDRLEAYKERLDGATPSEAAKRFAELERRTMPVPVEELQHLTQDEAATRQIQIWHLVDRHKETNSDGPSDEWINDQLGKLGKRWRAVNKGGHYETYEPARWG